MKKLIAVIFVLFSLPAFGVTYTNAKVTGVGIAGTGTGTESGDYSNATFRFTIDKDPNAIFFIDKFTDEINKQLVSIILVAYTTQSNIAFIRSSEASSASSRHYTDLVSLEVGTILHD